MLTTILALSLFAAPLPAQSSSAGRAVGQRFPDIELPTIDGSRSLRLSELRGSRVLLIEFASW